MELRTLTSSNPDSKYIEHVLAALFKSIELKRVNIKNTDQFNTMLHGERKRLGLEFTSRLIESMKQRCQAKGSNLKYSGKKSHKLNTSIFFYLVT